MRDQKDTFVRPSISLDCKRGCNAAVLAPSTACTATPSRLSPGKTCCRARIQRVSRPVQISAAASRNARHAYAVVRTRRRNARSSRSDSSKPSSVPTHSSSSLRTHSSLIQESPPLVEAVNGSRARIASSTMVAASTTIAASHNILRRSFQAAVFQGGHFLARGDAEA